MPYKWPRSPIDSRVLRPEEMTDEQRSACASLVAGAIADGSPSPGADFLIWLTGELGISRPKAILESLLGGRDVGEYLSQWIRRQFGKPGMRTP